MQYVIEVDDALNTVITSNAARRGIPVAALIAEILERYSIPSHIMEQNELWKTGCEECAEINLDWANL